MRARIRNISFLTLDSFTFRQLFSTRRTNVDIRQCWYMQKLQVFG